jgi:TPP-dependent pyruvate/acetoin dehydrogenase alpha subunit
MNIQQLYEQMYLIRAFEELLLRLFSQGLLTGTVHTCIGQEAIAVGAINNLEENDSVFSNHRCHGHFIAKGGDVTGLLAEIMGREGGVCGGRGGSQHLHFDNFYSNGVQGNMFPVAAGIALAEKVKDSNNIATIFVGDGTFGQGVLYESLNMVSLLKVPLLIIVENNRYAQSTPISHNFSGSFKSRAEAFDIPFGEIETNDVSVLYDRFKSIVSKVRMSKCSHMEVVHTYRLAPHSKGDDDRPKTEIEAWKEKDPLNILEKQISKEHVVLARDKVFECLLMVEEEVKLQPFASINQNILS